LAGEMPPLEKSEKKRGERYYGKKWAVGLHRRREHLRQYEKEKADYDSYTRGKQVGGPVSYSCVW